MIVFSEFRMEFLNIGIMFAVFPRGGRDEEIMAQPIAVSKSVRRAVGIDEGLSEFSNQ